MTKCIKRFKLKDIDKNRIDVIKITQLFSTIQMNFSYHVCEKTIKDINYLSEDYIIKWKCWHLMKISKF